MLAATHARIRYGAVGNIAVPGLRAEQMIARKGVEGARRVAGPVSGSRITEPRWRCRESRSRLAHGFAVSRAGGESPGALLVLRAAAGPMAIYQRILPARDAVMPGSHNRW